MPRRRLIRPAVLSLALACVMPLWAHGAPPQIAEESRFMQYHPDLRFRALGMQAFEQQHFEQAQVAFEHAARFADKPSQAMLAELYASDDAGRQDLALAYVWMDLAAERGYPLFIAKREALWERLTAEQKVDALDRGPLLHAEYGDDAAQPRMMRQLREGRLAQADRIDTRVDIRVPSFTGWLRLGEGDIRNTKLWDAHEYFAWQDDAWKRHDSPAEIAAQA